MPRQYVIENGDNPGWYLYKIQKDGRDNAGVDCRCFSTRLEEAILYTKKEEALAMARKCRGRVWRLKGGKPVAVEQ